MASSIFIQFIGFILILSYLFIRYKYPNLILSNVNVVDDEGELCPNGDIDCYDKCVDGICSNPQTKNIWYNIVILFITSIFFLYYSYIIGSTQSMLHLIFLIITILIFYISQRFNLEYSSYAQKLVSSDKAINTADPDNPLPDEDIIDSDELIFAQNKRIRIKNIVMLILYFSFAYIFYLGVWSKNTNNYSILSNSDNVFLFVFFGFTIYIFLDMIRNTKPTSDNQGWLFKSIKNLFNFDDVERENKLFDNSWIIYSIMNSANLVYIMIVGQFVYNSLTGKGDIGLRYYGIISLVAIIINYYQYSSIKNIQEGCNCLETTQLSISKNNLKMYQINLFILSMGIIYIIILPFITNNKLYNFKKYIKK